MNSVDIGKSVVLRFLRDYIEFGSWGHVYAAKAYINQINSISDNNEKDLLGIKLYTEFFLALEDLAALCIAIRHRMDGVGFIYGFLMHGVTKRNSVSPNTKIKDMFEYLVLDNPLSEALFFPPKKELIEKVPNPTNTEIPILYDELNSLLPKLGKLYMASDRAFVRAFNKTKHGFVVVRDGNIFQNESPDKKTGEAWIITDNPSYHPVNAKDKPVVEKFLNQTKDIKAFYDRIVLIRGAVVSLCLMMIELLERDLIVVADGNA